MAISSKRSNLPLQISKAARSQKRQFSTENAKGERGETHLEEFRGALLDLLGADDLLLGRGVPVREARLEVREAGDSRPDLLVRCAEGPENAEELVNL